MSGYVETGLLRIPARVGVRWMTLGLEYTVIFGYSAMELLTVESS